MTDGIEWRDGVPVSRRHDDPYYSLDDGLAESRHVFLGGNDLPDRFAPGFTIAELGFGTGLNALAAWDAWRAAGIAGDLRFVSFEARPLTPGEMARALAPFGAVSDLAETLVAAWCGGGRMALPGLDLSVTVGDAAETVPDWQGCADAWFLDGFAPARNPDLWTEALMHEVARHARPGGTAATYSAAGSVRRALVAAGFAVERVPGYGRKRHMVKAVLGGD